MQAGFDFRLRRLLPLLLSVFAIIGFERSSGTEKGAWDDFVQSQGGKAEWRVYVAMRDGVRLDTNIFYPSGGNEKRPVILVRTPYPIESSLDAAVDAGILTRFLQNGYIIVYQSERGRNWSEGEYTFLAGAADDGYKTIDWIVKQPWSNGKVATYGCSSTAENQLALAVAAHPGHATAIAEAPGAGIGHIGRFMEQGNFFRGGAIQLLFASWHSGSLFYGGAGANHRPRFSSELSREDRIRLSRLFSIQHNPVGHDGFFDHLPVSEIVSARGGPVTDWDEFSTRHPADKDWDATSFINEGDQIGVPVMWVFSWYDIGTAPNLAFFDYAARTSVGRGQGNQHMIVSPVTHCAFGRETENTIVGERDVGDARFDYAGAYMEWLDHWTKGKADRAFPRPKARYYRMGTGEWISSDVWPPSNARRLRYYLDSRAGANSVNGDGVLSVDPPQEAGADAFHYDPLRPVVTNGGGGCCMGGAARSGAFDQSTLEKRPDILVYTSSTLKADLEVSGFIDVTLHVSSNAKDTDFTVKLVDVYPDGRAFNLDDTILRMRYRNGYEKEDFMETRRIYEARPSPMATSNVFKAGHKIRLEISGSNFPRYDRNLNTGGDNFNETAPAVARNVVHHAPELPSYIELPVIDR